MEQWELQIQGFPAVPEPRDFAKALQTATEVLKVDLADYEIERLFHTFLLPPVALLNTVLISYHEEQWSNVFIDAFKLLGSIAGKYVSAMDPYFENIVKICHLPHMAHVRRQALLCLSSLARVTPAAAAGAARAAADLETASVCRTERALLVGTLCEFHPEMLEHQATRIWRTFLSFLGCNKLTDKFVAALLQGVSGLLASFGRSLPVCELWEFYDTMTKHTGDAPITILRRHACLFKERLASDTRTRAILWSKATQDGGAALVAVYDAVADVTGSDMKALIDQEVLPQLSSNKVPALCVLSALRGRGFDSDLEELVDAQDLEFDLREEVVTYYVADLVSWYIKSGLAHSTSLAQTALLFYKNVPAKKVDDLAAAILAQAKVREEAILFLASECSQPSVDNVEYMPVWKTLLVDAGTEPERTRALKDYMRHLTFMLETWLEGDDDSLPEKLASLLTLTTDILSLPVPEVDLNVPSRALSAALRQCRAPELLAASHAVLSKGGSLDGDVWQLIRIDSCRDEPSLCACCLLLLHASRQVDAGDVLKALQIIFTRHDVEDRTLLQAVKVLEDLIGRSAEEDLEIDFSGALLLVQKLQKRKAVEKDARILQRSVILFLGKYGGKIDVNNNEREVSGVTAKLKDSLYLAVPHLDTERVKINLQEVAQLAIELEDPEALQQLLKILCVTASSRRDASILCTMSHCGRALCRAACRGDTRSGARAVAQRALAFCDTPTAVQHLLTLISEEPSPGVRKLLSSCLPAMLSDELMESTLSRAADMMSGRGTTKCASMDLIDALQSSLEDNHQILKSHLPRILETIARTHQLESTSTFEKTSNAFINKLALFEIQNVESLMRNLIKHLITGNVESDMKTFKSKTAMCLKISKAVADAKKMESSRIFEMIFEIRERDLYKCLYVLAVVRNTFEFDSSFISTVFFSETVLDDLYNVDICYAEDNKLQLEAILVFMTVYAETILEYNYEKSITLLSSILLNIPPHSVLSHHPTFPRCISTFRRLLHSLPDALATSCEGWLEGGWRRREGTTLSQVKALNLYLEATGIYVHSFMQTLKPWPKQILKEYIDGATDDQLSLLSGQLTAAVRVTGFNVKSVLLEGKVAKEYVGVRFCATFMKVLLKCFLEKPYVLLDDDVGECCVVLDDVVKFCVRNKCAEEVYEQVLDLIDEVWPKYETRTSFHQKCELLSNVVSLPKSLDRESNPMRWVAEQLNHPASRENSARLVGVLPGGDEFSDCYSAFAATSLSTSPSECRVALRAALPSLAARPSGTLLRIVATLAATDEDNQTQDTKWFDKALDSCCASLARCERFSACDILRASDAGASLGVCRRMIVPILRYSTSSYCELFFSRHLQPLLATLSKKPRVSPSADKLRSCLLERTAALMMLQVAFEKIPLPSLQSPQSVLYRESNLSATTSNYLTATVCKLCVALRSEKCPVDAGDDFRKIFRRYQCAIYNCLCAAICKSRPADKFYDVIAGPEAWGRVCDGGEGYHLPIYRRRRKTRQPVSIQGGHSTLSVTPTATSTGTATTTRTKMFLRTLSEDPHKFDLYSREEEEVEIQEVQMTASEISEHPCAGTLTAVLTHTSELGCCVRVCGQLADSLARQANHLLAQCVCNCHEALAAQASMLRPALLAFAANTIQDGRLNGLHVEILETLIAWRDDPSLPESSLGHLQLVTEALVREAIVQGEPCLQVLGGVLEVYGEGVTVGWGAIAPYVESHNWKCLPAIHKLTKHKIRIPELVPTLLQIDLKHWLQDAKIPEVFGAALSCESERDGAIQKFRDMLKRVRQSEGYVKMLYYAQLGCKEICDEACFRQITDQTRKLPKTLQNKCLHILSTYISQQPIDYKTSMYETIELSEFLTTDNVEALGLVAAGLRGMEGGLKRRVVRQALEGCGRGGKREREAAFRVAAKAFEDLFYKDIEEPTAKKPKTNRTLLNLPHETDPYVLNVVMRVAQGVTSRNRDVTEAVGKVLSRNAGERLAECFSLLIVGNMADPTSCSPLLDIFFAELRENDSFLANKLREEPLEPFEPKGASNLFTDTKSCRGTLLSYRVSGAARRIKSEEPPAIDVDVQVSIDSILDSLLQFAKRDHRVAQSLLLQTVRCLPGRGFDSHLALANLLTTKLATPSDATPLYIQLGRVVVHKGVTTEGFLAAVSRLKALASGSDDEEHVGCLLEELQMRTDIGIYELRSAPVKNYDVSMDESKRFSLEDLSSCFGRLSAWDDLTVQQKEERREGLPVMWVDGDAFKEALDSYKVASEDTWLSILVSCHHEVTADSARWMLLAKQWPRRRFYQCAVAEALSWQLDSEPWSCEMSPKDCLLEWAARLMIRAAQASEREAVYPSHSNELVWCARANEMALYRGVLQCCQRNNIAELPKEDQIPWHHQKLLALRGMALQRNDSQLLKEALDTAVTLVSSLPEQTQDSIGIYKMYLEENLNDLTRTEINNILEQLQKPKASSVGRNKGVLTSVNEVALVHFDQQWAGDATKQLEVIENLASTLYRMRQCNLGPRDEHLALLTNRLAEYGATHIVDGGIKDHILQVLHPTEQYFDDFTADQVHSLGLVGKSSQASSKKDELKLLAAIRDPGHCLLNYCEGLAKAVRKKEAWNEIFDRIRDMMDNEYVGSDYHLLTDQRKKLDGIADYDSTTHEEKLSVLRSVLASLSQPPRGQLRVAQLCPALLTRGVLGGRVEDLVTVITNSVRRPCVLTVVTSRGARRKLLLKAGESLLRDASVLRLDPSPKYRVIPTSADSGLVDYLEDHETLYSLISSVCDLDEICASVQRPCDSELIVTPSPHTFKQLRDKVPVHALRTAIERNSSCFEDFLMKKRNFQDSLATTAVFNWILGLGDRHLENLMCSLQSGSLVGVDCGAALTFVRELPPARLTPCLLALTDITVLESRLQSALSQFRERHYLFCNFVKATFRWTGREIEDKLPHIQAIVSGRSLSQQVAASLLPAPYREPYLAMIREVFQEFAEKDKYSVVEQISCFMLHCTSPRILQVTRAGWTPWV